MFDDWIRSYRIVEHGSSNGRSVSQFLTDLRPVLSHKGTDDHALRKHSRMLSFNDFVLDFNRVQWQRLSGYGYEKPAHNQSAETVSFRYSIDSVRADLFSSVTVGKSSAIVFRFKFQVCDARVRRVEYPLFSVIPGKLEPRVVQLALSRVGFIRPTSIYICMYRLLFACTPEG